MTGQLIINNVLKVAGGNGFLPGSQGAHICWNRVNGSGRTDLVNHKGNGGGGFVFWNGDDKSQTELASLNSAGSLFVTGTISESGKRVYSPNNKPTANDVGALSASGGAVTGKVDVVADDNALTFKAATAGAANYIIGKNSVGGNEWYAGKGSKSSNDVALHSYVHGTSLILKSDRVESNKNLYIGGNIVLTDAVAAQKYALRSIRVNGKPLSADVNLLASDINAWNKTEADGRYLMKTAIESKVIYPGGTESAPPKIATNARIEVASPYSTLNCMIQIELLIDGVWGVASNGIYEGTTAGATFGIAASLLNDNTIIVKTGSREIVRLSNYDGNPWNKGTIGGYRLRVTKLGV
ncbi:hypothetical protein [Brenneria corticis]|uniref:Tail fibre protein gp37 trimerization region domain-containing protein n=1 Tax=Brenneria corticis TaxID=2173106 RepID=A0A2U1TTC2_9GAMM|nr:hypothetical protein DDT56_17330 [Brenneria sp. CFCC 11842]